MDLLSVVQQTDLTLLPISPQKSLGILGRGLSGQIQLSKTDAYTDFAFKEGIPEKLVRDSDDVQDWISLATEISILQHPPIYDSPHIVDLLGICFSIDSSDPTERVAWPLLVTLKANRGDLSALILNDKHNILTDDGRIQLFAEVAEAIYLLHECGIFMLPPFCWCFRLTAKRYFPWRH